MSRMSTYGDGIGARRHARMTRIRTHIGTRIGTRIARIRSHKNGIARIDRHGIASHTHTHKHGIARHSPRIRMASHGIRRLTIVRLPTALRMPLQALRRTQARLRQSRQMKTVSMRETERRKHGALQLHATSV